MDEKTERALKIFGLGVCILGIAMILFYYFQPRVKAKVDDVDGATPVATNGIVLGKTERSDFEGVYSSIDDPVQTSTHRLLTVQVARKEEGGPLIAQVRMQEIGKDDSSDFNCPEVKIQGTEFYLTCENSSLGNISIDATSKKDGSILVSGKFLWTKGAKIILDKQVKLQMLPTQP